MENQTPEVVLLSQKPKPNLALWVVVGIAILAAGVGIGLVAGKYFQPVLSSSSTPTTISTLTPSPTVASVEEVDFASSWKTYANNYWKVSFKYPENMFKPCFNYTTEKEGVRFWGPQFECPDGHDILYKIGFVGYDQGKYAEYKKPLSVETILIDGKQGLKKIYLYNDSDGPLSSSKQSTEVVFTLNNGIITLQQLGNDIKEQRTFDQILSTFKFLETSSNVCKSVNLGVSLVLPNKDWSCEIDNLGKDQKGWDGTLSLKTSIFLVRISSLGRGAFCSPSDNDPQSPRYDPTNSCTTSIFYSKNDIKLETFKLNGQIKEIFGQINGGPSVSISYNNMETKELSEKDKLELFQALDSISIEK